MSIKYDANVLKKLACNCYRYKGLAGTLISITDDGRFTDGLVTESVFSDMARRVVYRYFEVINDPIHEYTPRGDKFINTITGRTLTEEYKMAAKFVQDLQKQKSTRTKKIINTVINYLQEKEASGNLSITEAVKFLNLMNEEIKLGE